MLHASKFGIRLQSADCSVFDHQRFAELLCLNYSQAIYIADVLLTGFARRSCL